MSLQLVVGDETVVGLAASNMASAAAGCKQCPAANEGQQHTSVRGTAHVVCLSTSCGWPKHESGHGVGC